jgi:uncharacterized protein (DUF934 family)
MPTPKIDSEDTEILLDDLAHLANQIGSLLGQAAADPAALDQVQHTVKSLAISFGVYKDAWAAEDASLLRDGLKRVLVPIEFTGTWQILH